VGGANDSWYSEQVDIADNRAPARLRALPSWLLNQAGLSVNRLVTDALAASGLRRHHYSLLAALDDVGPSSQAELSRCTTIDRSDMVASVNELAERGFVARAADPDDGRRNVVSITASGRRELAKLDRLIAQAQSEWLAPLTKKERADLIALLGRIVDHHATAAD
jgi:DNA-binding MarR family transcriptional regulator